MHPQTLRKYERLGLIRPSRTVGMLRLYSNEDLEKLRLIRYLQENLGMNLAGVEFILNLLDNLLEMQRRVSHQAQVSAMRAIMEEEMRRLFQQLDLPFQR
jgi:MerR family transcriptional regulator/heat shock protein HspR